MSPDTVKQHFRDPRAVEHYGRAASSLGLWVSEEKIFRKIFQPENALLDLGCGAGRIAIALREMGYRHVLGVDFAPEMVERARQIARLLGHGLSFRVGDATALDFEDNLFDGAIFGFNGLMQIPRRERRRQALTEVLRVVRPGGSFVFTTHDRSNRRFRSFWVEEEKRWKEGEQDPRLEELGDRYFEAPVGATFMHIPTREEVLADLSSVGWNHQEDFLRLEIAKEPASVRDFSDECRFWIVRKPGGGSLSAGGPAQ